MKSQKIVNLAAHRRSVQAHVATAGKDSVPAPTAIKGKAGFGKAIVKALHEAFDSVLVACLKVAKESTDTQKLAMLEVQELRDAERDEIKGNSQEAISKRNSIAANYSRPISILKAFSKGYQPNAEQRETFITCLAGARKLLSNIAAKNGRTGTGNGRKATIRPLGESVFKTMEDNLLRASKTQLEHTLAIASAQLASKFADDTKLDTTLLMRECRKVRGVGKLMKKAA